METATQTNLLPLSTIGGDIERHVKAIWCDLDRPLRETRQRIMRRFLHWLALPEDQARAEIALHSAARVRLNDDDLYYFEEAERDVLLDGVTKEEAARLIELAVYLRNLAS